MRLAMFDSKEGNAAKKTWILLEVNNLFFLFFFALLAHNA